MLRPLRSPLFHQGAAHGGDGLWRPDCTDSASCIAVTNSCIATPVVAAEKATTLKGNVGARMMATEASDSITSAHPATLSPGVGTPPGVPAAVVTNPAAGAFDRSGPPPADRNAPINATSSNAPWSKAPPNMTA